MINAKETYKSFARFYDSYTKKFQADIPLYKSLTGDCPGILEVGCGTGRVLKELANDNKTITGVDISAEMLEIAKEKLKTAVEKKTIIILEHDFSNGSIKQKYDICLVTWFTFNYIPDNGVMFLRNISDCLHGGALIILDMFYPQALMYPEIDNKWVEKEIDIDGEQYRLKDKRTVINNMEQRIQIFETKGKTNEITTNRFYYSKADMQGILTEAGFSEVSFVDNYDLSTLHTLEINEKTNNNYMCIAKKAL